jgi:ribonuclease I
MKAFYKWVIRLAFVVPAFLVLVAAQSASAESREITGAGFRYYVLSLYWLPTLCIESPGADECRGSTRNGTKI